MKLLVLFISFLVSFTSCNPDKIENDNSNKFIRDSSKIDVLYRAKSIDSNINVNVKNVNNIEFITIGTLDVSKYDLGFFDSKQADLECAKLGDGWRLPNETELNIIFEKSDELETFNTIYYIGKDYQSNNNESEIVEIFLRKSIINGEVINLQSDQELFSIYGVRAVRKHR